MKAKREIKHETNYKELFLCLQHGKHWLPLLVCNGKDYNKLVEVLLDKGFYDDSKERLTMKFLSTKTGFKPTQIAKWLGQIYDDLLELNANSPEKFKREGVKYDLFFINYDSTAFWTEWLLCTPRIFERFNFYFIKAKVGIEVFWVKDVENQLVDNEHVITIWLEGGFVNTYREFALERALFENKIGFMDNFHMTNSEKDEIIKSEYKNR